MSNKEDALALLWHTLVIALLLLSELGLKLFLKRFGADFLPPAELGTVETALGWFTVGTLLLFLASCFTNIFLANCRAVLQQARKAVTKGLARSGNTWGRMTRRLALL